MVAAMLRRSLWIALVLLTVACGGAQEEPRGATFCTSFENNYLAACQQQCEAQYDPGDREAQQTCAKECRGDLAEEDEYTDSCSRRL